MASLKEQALKQTWHNLLFQKFSLAAGGKLQKDSAFVFGSHAIDEYVAGMKLEAVVELLDSMDVILRDKQIIRRDHEGWPLKVEYDANDARGLVSYQVALRDLVRHLKEEVLGPLKEEQRKK